MPLRAIKAGPRSFRFRLMFWNTLVMLAVMLITLFSVLIGLRISLDNELEAILEDEARELVLAIEANQGLPQEVIAEMQRKAQSHEQRGWFLRWMSGDGAETRYQSQLAPSDIVFNQVRMDDSGRILSAEGYLAFEATVAKGTPEESIVLVGTTEDFINTEVGRFTRVVLLVGLSVLLLTPIGGVILANQVLAPLHSIIDTASRLRPSHMEERLPNRGTEDELDKLALQINSFLDQIAQHLNQNREFVANAAHELRSPLAAILSSIEVTLRQNRSIESYAEEMQLIESECQHLTQLVNQLLQLAASDAGATQLNVKRIDLGHVANKVVEMFSAVAEEQGATLTASVIGDTSLNGDGEKLRQLITNLVDNGLKFSQGIQTVSVTVDGSRPETVQISVSDTGRGISKDDLPHIFDRFFQADRARRRSEARGTGLGLSICQSIVMLHLGELAAKSELGQGTTFTATLPRQALRDESTPHDVPRLAT